MCDFEYAETPAQLSSRHNLLEEFTLTDFGGDTLLVNDSRGFDTMATHLRDQIFRDQDPRLRVSEANVVTGIHYTNDKVQLTLESDEQISAEIVLMTASVGVLQSELVSWVPPLPNWKLAALSGGLNMAWYTKCFVSWEQSWLPTSQPTHTLIAGSNAGRWPILSRVSADDQGEVVCCTACGDEARRLEAMSDEDATVELMDVLRAAFPECRIDQPKAVHIVRWGNDRLYRGAYSVLEPGARATVTEELRKPLEGERVWFAGEACHDRYSGYLHGAYLSGVQVANNIADKLLDTI